VIKSQIIKANGEPVNVDYMMRRNGDTWLISDIYLDGAISEVATRRSEFGAILKNEGIDGLIAALNNKANILTARSMQTPGLTRFGAITQTTKIRPYTGNHGAYVRSGGESHRRSADGQGRRSTRPTSWLRAISPVLGDVIPETSGPGEAFVADSRVEYCGRMRALIFVESQQTVPSRIARAGP
jgi:hypothetical protein